MSGFIELEVQGLAELQRRLVALTPAIQTKIMKGMVATGAAIFKNEAIALAPYYTGTVQTGHPPPGTLKKSIYQFRIAAESVGTREVWRVSARKGNREAEAKGGNRDGYYATWVEYGTVKMPAHPFMRPAFEIKKQAATNAMGTYLAYALPAVVKDL